MPVSAHAASRTWDGGCGFDTGWSCAGNWSGDVAPSGADTVVFGPASTGNSTVDPAFGGTIAAVKLNAGYSGAVSLARSLTVSKSFLQKSGSFTAGGEELVSKTLTLSGGSFTASSGTTSIDATLKVTGLPSFDANGGTVDFGSTSGVLTCGGVTFNLVTLSHSSGTKTVGGDCNLPLGEDPVAGDGGSILLNGALSGSGTLVTSGTLTLGNSGSLSGFSALEAGALTVSGSQDLGGLSDLAVGKTFTLSPGGSLTAPAGTASFGGKFTIGSGATFDANGGTVTFDGTVSAVLSCGNQTFNLVRFAHTAGRKTVGSDCTLPLGSNPSLGEDSNASVTLNGTLSGSGTLTAPQTLVLNGTATLSGFSGLTALGGLTAAGLTLNAASYGTFAVNGNYTQTGGSVTAPTGADFHGQFRLNSGSTFNTPAAGSVNFANNFTINAGATFNSKGATVVFDGGHSSSISCGSATFALAAFANTSGTKTVGSSCSLPLGANPNAASGGSIALNGTLSGTGTLTTSGTLTLASGSKLSGFSGLAANALTVNATHSFGTYSPFTVGGTFTLGSGSSFTAPSGTASFAGDFVNSGNFIHNSGTVVLSGGSQQLSGSTTFNKLSKTVAAEATLTFAAESTVTAAGALTLKGAGASKLLKLASSTPGKPWTIEAKGSQDVGLVSVSDSTSKGSTVPAYASVNGGGNTSWSFPVPTAPGKPTTPQSPTKDATPSFTWTASTDGSVPVLRYEVQWSEDDKFKKGVISDAFVPTNSCDLSTTTCGGLGNLAKDKWSVRVRAFDQLGNPSAYSSITEVHIN